MERYYIEIDIKDNFPIIVETLTRIGIHNSNTNDVIQTCHLLHNCGKYYLVHFKELFSLFDFKTEGKINIDKIHMNETDFQRRNSIMFLLNNWGIINYSDELKEYVDEFKGNIKLFVVPFKEKGNYNLVSKFDLSKK